MLWFPSETCLVPAAEETIRLFKAAAGQNARDEECYMRVVISFINRTVIFNHFPLYLMAYISSLPFMSGGTNIRDALLNPLILQVSAL